MVYVEKNYFMKKYNLHLDVFEFKDKLKAHIIAIDYE